MTWCLAQGSPSKREKVACMSVGYSMKQRSDERVQWMSMCLMNVHGRHILAALGSGNER